MLRDGEVFPAKRSETKILGIVSANPAFSGGGAQLYWRGAFERDEWNRLIMKMQPKLGWKAKPNQTEADRPLTLQPVKSKDFDANRPYVPRTERPKKWTCVGLLGQIPTRVNRLMAKGFYVQSDNSGIGRLSTIQDTNIQCMHITHPFDAKKGYAVALCYKD